MPLRALRVGTVRTDEELPRPRPPDPLDPLVAATASGPDRQPAAAGAARSWSAKGNGWEVFALLGRSGRALRSFDGVDERLAVHIAVGIRPAAIFMSPSLARFGYGARERRRHERIRALLTTQSRIGPGGQRTSPRTLQLPRNSCRTVLKSAVAPRRSHRRWSGTAPMVSTTLHQP